jgi:hypothetical protein
MVLLLLIGGASSPALATINLAVSPPLEQTSADTVFMEMLLAHNDDLNDENKTLLQADISGRLRYGATRSRAGIDGITQTQSAIAWNNKAAVLSFILVHLAILLGFGGALVEFVHAFRLRREGKTFDDMEITLKFESIAVKTTSMGVILLTSSIVFYFLYLKFVYPVQLVPL